MLVLLSAVRNVLPHVGACEKPNYEWWEVCPLLGPIGYGMWLVHSNALPPTFINIDGVIFQIMILHMTPSIILIVIAE
jgi:hypothetical protein